MFIVFQIIYILLYVCYNRFPIIIKCTFALMIVSGEPNPPIAVQGWISEYIIKKTIPNVQRFHIFIFCRKFYFRFIFIPVNKFVIINLSNAH